MGHIEQLPCARWQAEMAPFFVDLDGRPDQGFLLPEQVFHLEGPLGTPPLG